MKKPFRPAQIMSSEQEIWDYIDHQEGIINGMIGVLFEALQDMSCECAVIPGSIACLPCRTRSAYQKAKEAIK